MGKGTRQIKLAGIVLGPPTGAARENYHLPIGINLKSEVRNPKPERNPNSENRKLSLKSSLLKAFLHHGRKPDCSLRSSGFFRISGNRISDFGIGPLCRRKWLVFGVFVDFLSNLRGNKIIFPSLICAHPSNFDLLRPFPAKSGLKKLKNLEPPGITPRAPSCRLTFRYT